INEECGTRFPWIPIPTAARPAGHARPAGQSPDIGVKLLPVLPVPNSNGQLVIGNTGIGNS
ncbi:MAG: hypothetical protein J6334_12645, partial [Kiritimatiellae bacterium]|nr:hypothetical protein [Kiritimatiellia bacterium]